jgi:hypothetical protein
MTRQWKNLQQPPKCSQYHKAHLTYSHKCKDRHTAAEEKPYIVVLLKTQEKTDQATSTNVQSTCVYQPVTIEQMLAPMTMSLQNIRPFVKSHILQQIQYAARTILQVNFNASYSGPCVYFHASHIKRTP